MTHQATAHPPASMISPDEAIGMLTARVESVETERVDLRAAAGRVLRENLVSDRPSPTVDVSAMDGYAVRTSDLRTGRVAVVGEVRVGSPPPVIESPGAVRIMTGGPVPATFDAVIRREDVTEHPDSIEIDADALERVRRGLCIRKRGENVGAGGSVAKAGSPITPALAGALATFGVAQPLVSKIVRIAYLSTGDELAGPQASVSPWQIRDSSGPALRAFVDAWPTCELIVAAHAPDELKTTRQALHDLLERCDLLITTGGVSAGDRDFVPQALAEVGARTVFHRVAQRPGKPLLGAIGPSGQAILALPGNPVSVMVSLRRIVWPILNHLAGRTSTPTSAGLVSVAEPFNQTLDLWQFPLVRLDSPSTAALVASKGSGDIVSVARSDGFVEIPPSQRGSGPWVYYPWGL